jgi:endonuclease I
MKSRQKQVFHFYFHVNRLVMSLVMICLSLIFQSQIAHAQKKKWGNSSVDTPSFKCPTDLKNQALLDVLYEQMEKTSNQAQVRSQYKKAKVIVFKQVEAQVAGGDQLQTLYSGKFVKFEDGRWPNDVNCEHVWPRSWMGNKSDFDFSLKESDMHNLFPEFADVNRLRGNLPFAELSRNENEAVYPSMMGKASSGKQAFMPRAEVRGDVARVLFYFSMRWKLPIYQEQEAILKKWAKADPVSEREIQRNQLIAQLQGNVNPFIVCPKLFEQIADF